ncbi:MAG: sigma-70 family RNA polymerase sigma factor [Acidobacteria bacterium]|nr:MAG: sigma-70 family RNA polymerase sigma factor [Acidobacteriota bacterium]
MQARNESESLEELLSRCAGAPQEDDWAALAQRTRKELAAVCGRVARRWGNRDLSVAEDMVQEVYARLVATPALSRFEARGEGSGLRYLKAIAAAVTHDHFRGIAAQKRGGGVEELPLYDWAEPAASGNGGAEQQLLLSEVESALQRLSRVGGVDRNLLIFQLHYRLGMTAQAIASIPALELSAKGVESALGRMIRLIQGEVLKPKAVGAGAK